MSTEKIFLLNPYDDKHVEMLKDFEESNDIQIRISDQLEQLRSSVSEKDYLEEIKDKNEIEENICLEKESKLIDICHLHVEKDIKLGRINLAPIKDHNKKFISLVNDYAFNVLRVVEMFTEIDEKDKSLMTYLENHGYENLGEENGKVIYLKEPEEEMNIQRMIV